MAFAMAAFALMTFNSCGDDDNNSPVTPRASLETIVNIDMAFLNEHYPDANDVLYYESEVTLTKKASEITDSPEIQTVTSIYKVKTDDTYYVVAIYHSDATNPGKYESKAYERAEWLGDVEMTLPLDISLTKSFEYLKQSNCVIPTSDMVTLRQINNPKATTEPVYSSPTTMSSVGIFDQSKSFKRS